MPLDEKDLEHIKSLMGQAFQPMNQSLQSLQERLKVIESAPKPEPKAEPKSEKGEPKADSKTPEKTAELDAQKRQQDEIQAMQRELRRAALEKHLPANIIPERVGMLTKLLEADNRLISREGQHMVRLERNGQMVDVPLAEGLKEWAGTREADPFVRAATAGTGATPSQSLPSAGNPSITKESILAAALGKLA